MIAGNIATFIVSEEDLSDKDKKLIEEMEMEVARIAEIHNIKADSFY
jgi:predicted transcriptional regulator